MLLCLLLPTHSSFDGPVACTTELTESQSIFRVDVLVQLLHFLSCFRTNIRQISYLVEFNSCVIVVGRCLERPIDDVPARIPGIK